MRYQKHRVNKNALKIRLRVGLLLTGAALVAINLAVRPRLKEMTAIQASYISTHAIDEAAAEVLAREDIRYDDLVTLHLLEDGTVGSMTANIREMNRFKTELSKEVQRKIQDYQEREVSVPLGTLTGIDLFSGRGPRIKMKIELYGNVMANLQSSFEGAGINQTRHRIICDVDVGVSAIIPGCSSYTDVSGSFTVSETVLLGDVPDSYTNVDTTPELYDEMNNFLGD